VRSTNPQQIGEYRKTFLRTVDAVLGQSAFRVLGSNGEPAETSVNRALLESQLLACSWVAGAHLPSANVVKKRVAALFKDETFTDAVQRATGDRSRTLKRARDTVAAIQGAGAQMQVPHNLNH
jgi:hypothetical protein